MDLKSLLKNKFVWIGVMVVTAFIFVCCCLIWALSQPTPETLPTPTPTITVVVPPTITPIPTSTLPPIDDLQARIKEVLGESNRSVERVSEYVWDESTQTLFVQFAINDNLLESFIVTGIQTDVTDILKTVSQSGLVPGIKEITISGTFVLVDNFGNKSEDIVLTLTYSRPTMDKINWDNFQYSNVFKIADQSFFHPALQKIMLAQ